MSNKYLGPADRQLIAEKWAAYASVREIAAHLCFSDEHYFSSLFRQKIGVSPLAYRREPHRLA